MYLGSAQTLHGNAKTTNITQQNNYYGAATSAPTVQATTRYWGLREKYEHFTGRVDDLDKLKGLLSEGKTGIIAQYVAGLGGVGKSTLAREFAHRALKEGRYDYVLWLNAKSQESLIADFQQLALLYGMSAEQVKAYGAYNLTTFVYDKLSRYPKRLIIFDDAPTEHILCDANNNFLPPLVNDANSLTHYLVTTRNQQFTADTSAMIKLDSFSPQEAQDYITKRLPGTPEDAANALAKTLHYFPLALSQAVAFMVSQRNKDKTKTPQQHVDNYLKLYTSNQRDRKLLLASKVLATDLYAETVYTTWTISIDELREANPLAERVLDVCAYLSSNDIPCSLLNAMFSEAGELAVSVALDALSQYSLVSQDGDSVSVHGLVQTVVQMQLAEVRAALNSRTEKVSRFPETQMQYIEQESEYVEKIISALIAGMKGWFHTSEQERRALRYHEHVKQILQHFPIWPSTLKERVDYMALLSWWLNVRSAARDENIIENDFIDELTKLVQHFITQTPMPAELVFAYFVLGSNKLKLQELDAAQAFLSRGNDVAKALGLTKTIEACLLNNLKGRIHLTKKSYVDAETTFNAVLTDLDGLFPSPHREKFIVLRTLGQVYLAQNRPTEAEQCYTQSLTMEEAVNLAPTESKGATLHELGKVFQAQDLLDEAKEYFTKSLKMKEDANCAPTESKGVTLHELGNVCQAQNRLDEARQYFTQSLEMQVAANSAPTESKGVTLYALGEVCQAQNRLDDARQYFTQSLAVQETTNLAPTEFKSITLHALGKVYQAQNHLDEARRYFTQSLAMQKSIKTAPNSSKGATLFTLPQVYPAQNRPAETEQYFTRGPNESLDF